MRAGSWALLAAMVIGGCSAPEPTVTPQRTSLSGSVFGRNFAGGSAAFAEVPGSPRSLLIRVTTRPDTCAAVHDPSDGMDPSLLIAVTPDQAGDFAVVPASGPTPARFATASVYTREDLPDGGVPDGGDAGLRPLIFHATGGEVKVEAYEPGEHGVLNASVVLSFEGEDALVGTIGATGCDRVR